MTSPRVLAALPASCALVLLAGACSSERQGTVRLDLGEEVDALSRAPAPVTLVVSSVDLDENVKELSRTPLPASTIDLGEVPRTDVGAIRVAGLLADGTPVVKGTSLFVQWGALERGDLPVFAQRVGELARLPAGPSLTDAAVATVVAGRWMVAAKGTATTVYDLLQLRTYAESPTLPRTARSLATYGSVLIAIDEGAAAGLDLGTGATAEVVAPSGGTLAEVSGGLTFFAKDGSQLVVGATRREGDPTARVLRVGTDGSLSFASLASPRRGACATWVEGRGLVVWGGSDASPGGELLAPGATTAVTLPFPPDAVTACAAAPLGPSTVLIAGGARADGVVTRARVVDLACTTSCAVREVAGEVPLLRAEALAVAGGAALVTGDDATGATRAFRVTESAIREVALRAPRRGARLLASPLGGALVVSGAPGLEHYTE